MPGIYVTSKVKHAAMWLSLRESGVPVISTWIDDTQDGETKLRPEADEAWEDLWRRCIDEASNCDALVAFVEPDDVLKGGLVEIGAALGNRRPVFVVGTFAGSFCRHRLVIQCSSVSEAVNKAMKLIRDPEQVALRLREATSISLIGRVDANGWSFVYSHTDEVNGFSAKLQPVGRSSTVEDWAFLGRVIAAVGVPMREDQCVVFTDVADPDLDCNSALKWFWYSDYAKDGTGRVKDDG